MAKGDHEQAVSTVRDQSGSLLGILCILFALYAAGIIMYYTYIQ